MIWFGTNDAMGIDYLRANQYELVAFVTSKPVLAALAFIAIYALAVAASIPALAVFTMAGGYLFGWVLGTAYTMIAATLASTCVFLIARSALGETMRERAGSLIKRFADGFQKSGLTYVFIMNLIPIFPYFVVTTLPAACGVPLTVYVVGTFFGILPATILLSRVGSGLGDVLAQDGPIEIASFLTTDIMLSMAGLAFLALLPVLYKGLKLGSNLR